MTEETHAVPAFLRDLFGWYSMVLLGLGRRTGLLDALLSGPGTAEEIAARAGVDTRNALEWLRGLAASGHVSHAGGVFRVDQSTAMMFSPAFPVDARSVVDFTVAAPSLYDEVVAAMRQDPGSRSALSMPCLPLPARSTGRRTSLPWWANGSPQFRD